MLAACDLCGSPAVMYERDQDGRFTLLCIDCHDMRAPLPKVEAPAMFNELPGCTPEPTPHTYCAAAYLVYLEHNRTGAPCVPAGEPTLCNAHQAALVDQIVSLNPGTDIDELKHIAREEATAFILAAYITNVRLVNKYS